MQYDLEQDPLIPCPECGARTLRDPRRHDYRGTRCPACGAEFTVKLRSDSPHGGDLQPVLELVGRGRGGPDPSANSAPREGGKIWLLAGAPR